MNKKLTLTEDDLISDYFNDFDRACFFHLIKKREDAHYRNEAIEKMEEKIKRKSLFR